MYELCPLPDYEKKSLPAPYNLQYDYAKLTFIQIYNV